MTLPDVVVVNTSGGNASKALINSIKKYWINEINEAIKQNAQKKWEEVGLYIYIHIYALTSVLYI